MTLPQHHNKVYKKKKCINENVEQRKQNEIEELNSSTKLFLLWMPWRKKMFFFVYKIILISADTFRATAQARMSEMI